MKTRLIGVEMLWTRVKQLEIRQSNTELWMQRLNGRISNWMRRQNPPADTEEPQEELQSPYAAGDPLSMAEFESKRQHSAQKLSAQQLAQQTTT